MSSSETDDQALQHQNEADGDIEQSEKKIKYPKSVFFIVTNEFCERFCYYGLRTILALYLNRMLGYSKDTATVIYHVFVMFAYFFPVLGAVVADSWLGKYKTILYLSIVYAVGNIIVAVTAIPTLGIPERELTIVGLLLISLGTGGIKPCVSAFGGDQFVLPQQEIALQRFFSVFYFSINAGSFVSTFITPILREDVHCFEQDSCFSIAFGVPAMLMVVSIIAFIVGSRWYKMKAPEGNIIVEVSKCMWHAIRNPSKTKRDHWLDRADDKFDKQFIEDVKAALQVFVLYIPLPIFWALFDQQGSRWTFQAARMNGEFSGFTLKPDQMQVLNPILILAFIPLWEAVVYPLLNKCNLLKSPLQKMIIGGLLAGLAFVISAVVEFQLEDTYPVLPQPGAGQLRFYNVLGCDATVQFDKIDPFVLKNLGYWENKDLEVGEKSLKFDCSGKSWESKISVYDNEATSYTLFDFKDPFAINQEDFDKSDDGDAKAMIIYNKVNNANNWAAKIEVIDSDGTAALTTNINNTAVAAPFLKLAPNREMTVAVDGVKLAGNTFDISQGGGYVFLITDNENVKSVRLQEVTQPNSVNILWLIPQYVIITAGEIMFSIPGLEFSFTQAPLSMKSLITSVWLLTVAFGNLIVIIVAEAKFFDSQAYEFLLFAGLMFIDMAIFTWQAYRYKYKEPIDTKKNDEIEANGNNLELKDKQF